MDVARTGSFVVLMLSPTLAVGAALCIPRGIRELRRRVRARRIADTPQPSTPPIEELATDLRRLLQRHEALRQSTEVAMRARHLRALEAAITDCASDAACALGLACPERRNHAALAHTDLRRLLHSLADAGLVLLAPGARPATGLLAPDGREGSTLQP